MKTQKFLLLLIIVFGVLLARLFQLMVLDGGRYQELSEGQRIRERKIEAPRGLIRDRNGEVLARNKPIYKIARGSWQVARGEEEFEIIPHEEALQIEAKGGLEAARLKMEVARDYLWGEILAHVIGYTGEVTKEEIKYQISNIKNYEVGDRIGRMGVEEEYDDYLRGEPGRELIETDAQGEPLRVLGKIEPQPGKDLTLTIDFSLQKRTAQALEGKKGAVVVSDPKNGQVLALFSSPSFDPNLFEEGPLTDSTSLPQASSGQGIEGVLEDPDKPLFNRAISGLYPPGSVFKIITAAAGLEEGVIDEKTEIEDIGVIQIGPYRFANWYFTQYGKKEGMVDIVKAIKRSNDIFFYKVGQDLGIENLAKWARSFGVEKVLGIDLPGEAKGMVPDPEWKKAVKEDSWFLGDTYHISIGQGDLLVTPLQVNFWTAAIANGGKLCRPRVALGEPSDRFFSSRHSLLENKSLGHRFAALGKRTALPKSPPYKKGSFGLSRVWAKESSCQDIGLSQETVGLIKKGMKQACQPGGTGWPLFNFKVQSAKFKADGKNFIDAGGGLVEIPTGCKTGTAEFGPSTSSGQARAHAWFTIFAPFEDPEIVVTVLVEGGGEGSYVAAPIAKEVLEEWFER